MRQLTTGIRSAKCVVGRFRRCASVYLHKPRQYSLLHTQAIWYSLLFLGFKPVQHITALSPPLVALRSNAGHGLLVLEVSRSHTTTHHIRQDSSGRVISALQRPLPDNTQHSQQTDIHDPGGIRTHNLSRQAAVDLRLRPRSHWDRIPY